MRKVELRAISPVESGGIWSLFRWASVFYILFCSLAMAGVLFFPPLQPLIQAWPRSFVLAFQKFVPLGNLSLGVAMLLGYALLAPLSFYLQLRGPRLVSSQARAAVGLLLCGGIMALLTIAATSLALVLGWPTGE